MSQPYGPRTEWVATPPAGPARPVRRGPGRQRGYFGPPAYRGIPRWGFPLLAWRPTEEVPGGVHPPERTAASALRAARVAGPAIWAAAVATGLGGLGEIFRYVLLVLGRDQALPDGLVAGSDALVNTAAGLAIATGLLAAGLTLRWLLIVRTVAARQAGLRPGRPDWAVLTGVLLPVLNLFVAGSVLAELEHTARGARGPVRPTRLVLVWWAVWAGNELAAIVTLVLRARPGIQALADGVLWHAITDLAALALAIVTLRVVGEITALVAPAGHLDAAGELRGSHVVGVTGAPPPALRPARPAGAPR